MSIRPPDDREATCLPCRVGYTRLKSDHPSAHHNNTGLTSWIKQKTFKIRRLACGSSIDEAYDERPRPRSMSQQRVPYDPSHLPRRQTGIPSAPDMAQIQRPPSFPSAGFLGRSDQRPVPGPQLPPLLGLPAQQRAADKSGRPMQLPSMEPSPTMNDPPKHQGGRVIPVANLLSNSPQSPNRASFRQPAPPQPQAAGYRSPTEPPHISPNALPQQRPTYQPIVQHRLDNPPQYLNRAQPPHPRQQTIPPGPPPPAQYPSPTAASREETRFSPAPTSYSTPSCYDSQSEISPTTVAPPSHVFPRMPQAPPLNYNLTIRQQPAAARACGFGERDRRVIDPPPILELKITDKTTGSPEQDHNGMLALHCTLLNPSNQEDETQIPASASTDMQSTRRLMGTLVASPYQAKDERGVAGTFFVFPDLSCRAPGRYRLHFKLLRIDPYNMQQGTVHGTVASIITDVFSVYTAKDFPGMRASSALLKALRRQGLNVGVKKGSEARRGKGRMKKEDASSSEDEDSDGSGGEKEGMTRRVDSGSALGGDLSAKIGKTKKKRRHS